MYPHCQVLVGHFKVVFTIENKICRDQNRRAQESSIRKHHVLLPTGLVTIFH